MLLYTLANLDEEQLKTLQSHEKKTGKKLLAFSSHPVDLDMLDKEELDALYRLEADLGVTLIAVK